MAAYIGLNVVYCFPEIWDPASGKSEETDYRQTKFYQHMLETCTAPFKLSDVDTYPHRQFFGVSDRHRFQMGISGAYGMTFQMFLGIELPIGHLPGLNDVDIVRWLLCRKGLPLELALDIMEEAGYEAVRKVPYDPFHPRNRGELRRYLKYCWQTLVRCDLLAKTIGWEVYWNDLIADCLIDLFGHEDSNSKKWYVQDMGSDWPEWHWVFT